MSDAIEVANALIFNEPKQLLIVKKKDTWILPGGKPNPNESDKDCLEREVFEELSGTRIRVDSFYNFFEGVSPNRHLPTMARVYFCSLVGQLGKPSGEITDAMWLDYQKRKTFPLSEITREIVEDLWVNGIYTGR